MRNKILDLISAVTHRSIPELEKNMDTKDLWDSFRRVELVLALEEEFKLLLEPEEIIEMNTPEKVVACIEMKVIRP